MISLNGLCSSSVSLHIGLSLLCIYLWGQIQMFYAWSHVFPPCWTLSNSSEITQRPCACSPLTLPTPLFSWWLTAEDTCGGTLRGSSGLISSFDFPSGDSPGAGGGGAGGLGSSGECKWTILADPGDTISLVFTEFQMEEKSDYLEVEGSELPTIWWVEPWGGVNVWCLYFIRWAFTCYVALLWQRGVYVYAMVLTRC